MGVAALVVEEGLEAVGGGGEGAGGVGDGVVEGGGAGHLLAGGLEAAGDVALVGGAAGAQAGLQLAEGGGGDEDEDVFEPRGAGPEVRRTSDCPSRLSLLFDRPEGGIPTADVENVTTPRALKD